MRKKQKLLVGLASLTLFDIAVATAADLPVKAPVRAPSVSDWSGFYIGGHAGYRWADADFSSPGYIFDPGGGALPFPARNEGHRANGGIFGAQAGFNFMLSPTVLAGLEGDWSWGSGKHSTAATVAVDPDADGFTFRRNSELKLTWQATIRGRLGIVNGPWLFYGTGGVAFIHVRWSDASTDLGGASIAAWRANKTLTGWTIGAGAEYMYTSNWIGRLEYLYENFNSVSVPHGFGPQSGKLDIGDAHKLRVAISYKFGR